VLSEGRKGISEGIRVPFSPTRGWVMLSGCVQSRDLGEADAVERYDAKWSTQPDPSDLN